MKRLLILLLSFVVFLSLFAATETENLKNLYIFTGKNDLSGLLNENGKEIVPAKYTQIEVLGNDRIALFAKDGIKIADEKGQIIDGKFYEIGYFEPVDEADPNSEMFAAASLGPNKYGFIDKSGNFKIAPVFEEVHGFSNGFAPVKISGKWGLIDKNGKIAIKTIYDDIWIMQKNGLLLVVKKANTNKKGVVKNDGTVILNCEYDKIQAFNKLLYAYKKEEDKSRIFDFDGKLLFATEGNGTLLDRQEGMTSFETKKETVIFDTANEIVFHGNVSLNFGAHFYKGRIEIETPEKQRKYFDIQGKEVYVDSDENKNFIEWHIFEKNGKSGIMTSDGKIIVPAEYDKITAPFPIQTADVLIVVNKDFYGVIDRAGRKIFPIEYEYINHFYDGEAIASKNGKYMVLEKSGKIRFVSKYPIEYLIKRVKPEFMPKKKRWIY